MLCSAKQARQVDARCTEEVRAIRLDGGLGVKGGQEAVAMLYDAQARLLQPGCCRCSARPRAFAARAQHAPAGLLSSTHTHLGGCIPQTGTAALPALWPAAACSQGVCAPAEQTMGGVWNTQEAKQTPSVSLPQPATARSRLEQSAGRRAAP